jgi:hypothetical protein
MVETNAGLNATKETESVTSVEAMDFVAERDITNMDVMVKLVEMIIIFV